jgi:ribonucleoside-diphosphate reductase alpha chain
MTQASRRTGCGITALGDMLAAINCKYDSDKAMKVTQAVMQTKMKAELDCTIDLAILRGTFEGWDISKEWISDGHGGVGKNSFYQMLIEEFPEQVDRMIKYGRRNVSWSTVAPTGTVSILTQTTSGLEPLFSAYYMRRKKVNALEKGVRVDFTDQNGDTWQEYPVLHPKFKEWLFLTEFSTHDEDRKPFEEWLVQEKNQMQQYFEKSPWYKSTANDISWEKRIEIQSIIQRYTTNAISSTINLPNNVSKEVVSNIYLAAWKSGLKGVTIYRDGCRTGILVTETTKKSSFEYTDAAKRPKGIDADLHVVTVKGIKYGVVIGKMDDKPYEVFAFNAPTGVKESAKGEIVKVKRGHYNFISEDEKIENIQDIAVRHDEQVLTRLISGMLRHGAKPQFVMEQIDKCDLEVVSFGKAISRTLKKYVKEDELISRNKCSDCGSTNLRMQEGCLTCNDCGTSRCS